MGNTCSNAPRPTTKKKKQRREVQRILSFSRDSTNVGDGPFDKLLYHYKKTAADDLMDVLDAADVDGCCRSAVEIVDPRALALTKIRSEDDTQLRDLLHPIFDKYKNISGDTISKESLGSLVKDYLAALREWMPQFQLAMVSRIVRLFVASDSEELEKSVCDALHGGMSPVLEGFFASREDNLPQIINDSWESMDTNGDGVVDKEEFLNKFLHATDTIPMADAVHSAIADEVGALVSKKLMSHLRTQPGRCGLANLGNTCYMNSAIQCVSALTKFRQHFLSEEFVSALHGRKSSNSSGSKSPPSSPVVSPAGQGKFAKSFATLLKLMWCGKEKCTPSFFKKTVGQYSSRFAGCAQQDSQEFLLFLLEHLHDDLNEATSTAYKELPDTDSDTPDAEAARLWWDNHVERQSSPVVKLFHGQYRGVVECTGCKHMSITYDPFILTSLPMKSTKDEKETITVEDCFNLHMESESLSRECVKCKVKEAKKTLRLWRLPRYLIVHLKRFQQNGTKILTPVVVPQCMDPSPWVARPMFAALADMQSSSPAGHTRMSSITSVASSVDENTLSGHGPPPGNYHLYGVINHFGSAKSGHYTATCKSGKEWITFDDSVVQLESAFPYKKATTSAYVLFYALR